MRLKIAHTTTYDYDPPPTYGLQRLRLRPPNLASQQIADWEMTVVGATTHVGYQDEHFNAVDLIGVDEGARHVSVAVRGSVETFDTAGVTERVGHAPLWLYERSTPLTKAGDGVTALIAAADANGLPSIDDFHNLAGKIAERIDYLIGETTVTSTAEEAIAGGAGVCQDHAHVFISCARTMGVPARYVSGYLMMNDRVDQAASHAWAEVWLDHLGWLGFDVSNGISPDERYVRVATGLDYLSAAPSAGVWTGQGNESIEVQVQVQQ